MFPAAHPRWGGEHLPNRQLVQLHQTLGLPQPFADEMRVHRLQIGQAHQLMHVGMVAEVAFQPQVGIPPTPGAHPEQRHVQQVGLARIDKADLLRRQGVRNQVVADGIGMDQVVDLGQVAPDVPTQLLELLFLEALEFLDQIKLGGRDPTGELEGDVLLGEGAAVTPGLGNQADSGGVLDPLLGRQGEAIEAGLFFKSSNSMT